MEKKVNRIYSTRGENAIGIDSSANEQMNQMLGRSAHIFYPLM